MRKKENGDACACVAVQVNGHQVESEDPLLWCVQTAASLWLEELDDLATEVQACKVILIEQEEPTELEQKPGYWPEQCMDTTMRMVPVNGKIQTNRVSWNPDVNGITLLELFSGIGVGLEAVLKAGLRVKIYVC